MPTMRQIGSVTAGSIAPGATGGPLYLTKNGAGAPPYSFAGAPNTGVDSSGADTLKKYIEGQKREIARQRRNLGSLPVRGKGAKPDAD